jgi:rhodanese-related sulfurtransferase
VEDLVSREALRRQLETDRRPIVVDVRDAEEYAAGHVAGAVHIPADELADRLGELPAERPVVTYCNMRHRGQSRGEKTAALLRERGYSARVLDGGYPDWQAAGLPVTEGPAVSAEDSDPSA